MSGKFMLHRRAALLGAAALASPSIALAQAWPQRDLRMIVPFPPGGSTDVLARFVAQAMREQVGRPVVVENQAGAGGTTSAGRFAREGDDHAMFVSQIATHGIAPSLFRNLPYDSITDFRAVSLMTTVPNVWMANRSRVPHGDVRRVLRDAKARPNEITYASAGNGTSTHLTGELISQLAGVQMTHVPYRGAGPGMTALMGGEVDTFVDNFTTALPQIRAGTVIALAVTSAQRRPELPDVPALAELGAEFNMEGFSAEAWFGLHTHRTASDDVVERMAAAVRATLANPALQAQLAERGTEIRSSTPAEYEDLMRRELARWRTVVERGNITVN